MTDHATGRHIALAISCHTCWHSHGGSSSYSYRPSWARPTSHQQISWYHQPGTLRTPPKSRNPTFTLPPSLPCPDTSHGFLAFYAYPLPALARPPPPPRRPSPPPAWTRTVSLRRRSWPCTAARWRTCRPRLRCRRRSGRRQGAADRGSWRPVEDALLQPGLEAGAVQLGRPVAACGSALQHPYGSGLWKRAAVPWLGGCRAGWSVGCQEPGERWAFN